MKRHLFLGFIGALALAACSDDEPIQNSGTGAGNTDAIGDVQYLAVNIVTAPSAAPVSKAEGDTHNGTYEDGSSAENKVSSVRFYFFDNAGNPLNIGTETAQRNYYDWKATDATGKEDPNIEKMLTATIVIHKGTTPPTDDEPDPTPELPSQMIAIINPDATTVKDKLHEMVKISDLRDVIAEDYVQAITDNEYGFVMANSAYKDNGGDEYLATQIPTEKYQNTAELAKNNPIDIYVERNVAKVRVKFAEKVGYSTETHRAPLKDKIGDTYVYIEFNSWNVTAETNLTRLCKKIDVSWADNLFGATEPWYYSPYFRSYWATNAAGAQQSWHSFEQISEGGKQFDGSSIYLNENTYPEVITGNLADGTPKNPIKPYTKVILKGKLVKEDGTALEVCKYAGSTYLTEDALKDAMLASLQLNGMIYKHYKKDGNSYVTALTKDMVEFKTALEVDGGVKQSDGSYNTALADEDRSGRYYVYLRLKAYSNEGEQDIVWNTNADNATHDDNLSDFDAINTYLRGCLSSAQIYKGGNTYYFFPIQHLGADNTVGKYGIVRNHIYDCTINDIKGFGTPVYNPEETIYPEKPKEEDTFIGAQIKILSWRVVSSDITLD